MTETTDPTAAIEVWARMLCAADVHVHGEDHPTWQHLVGEPGSRIRDDYRKAAAWLLPKMTVAAKLPAPADRPAILREAADDLEADYPPESGYDRGRAWVIEELRRMADEAQQPETQAFVCKCPAELCHCGHHAAASQPAVGAQQPKEA